MALVERDGQLVAVGPKLSEFVWAVEAALCTDLEGNHDGVYWIHFLTFAEDYAQSEAERLQKGEGTPPSYIWRARRVDSTDA